MNSIALPRIKARRKRRKPMPPWLKIAIAVCVFEAYLIFCRMLDVSQGDGGAIFWLLFDTAAGFIWWNIAVHEWRKWKNDDGA